MCVVDTSRHRIFVYRIKLIYRFCFSVARVYKGLIFGHIELKKGVYKINYAFSRVKSA